MYLHIGQFRKLLSLIHSKSRLNCEKTCLFISEEYVKKIIFNDESKFNSFGSDKSVFKWRSPDSKLHQGNLIEPIMHEVSSVAIWGCFLYEHVCKLIHIEEIDYSAKF